MEFTVVSPAEPATAALLDEYFKDRVHGFPTPGGYRRASPDPALFVPPAGVFLRLDASPDRVHGASAGVIPIGCGGIRRIEPDARGERLEIKHLYLAPEARGRGAGRALLRELERWAAELGAATVVLDTNASLVAAGNLYRSAGYTPVPPYNDNPNATDWFAKQL